jgi:hypothetical protein
MLLVDCLSVLLNNSIPSTRFPVNPLQVTQKKGTGWQGKEGKSDLRRVGIVLAGVIPWVDNSISHQLGMSLSLGCLGHTASQLRAKARNRYASTVCASDGIIYRDGKRGRRKRKEKEHTRSTQQHIIHQLQ